MVLGKMRIGELSELSGLSRDTIRFYERNGLVRSTESGSETNSYRVYPDNAPEHLRRLAEAREAGLSIADLRDIMEASQGNCGPELRQRVLNEKIAELEARAGQIERAIAFLKTAMTSL